MIVELWKFLLKLGAGIAAIVIGTLALGLGVLAGSWLLLVFSMCAMISGVALAILSIQDFRNPDFLQRLVMRSMRGSRWTNTICPTCFWFMRDEYDADGVRTWFCVNAKHSGTRPVVKP